MGASPVQHGKWLQIDFMKRRYVWFAMSGAIVLVGLFSLGFHGLNLGIDFKGGTQYTFSTPQYVHISAVRKQAAAIGSSDAIVQGQGKAQGSDEYKQFQIRLRSLSSSKQSQLSQDLTSNLKAKGLGVKNVSASFGSQIANSAILAIVVSLILIMLYVSMRFDLKYAVPVIAAMIHDVVITVGVYALLRREVTIDTIAAVLTVLGYSIYDTIIIFDRIRENVPLMRRQPFATIVNVSLWETIRRSLATTFITLLPIGALFIFGGSTLKDFAFALMVGVTSGAYSSIFIAAPLLTIWKEHEPEYSRRKGQETELPAAKQRSLRVAQEQALRESEQALAAEESAGLDLVLGVEQAAKEVEREVKQAARTVEDAEARRAKRRQRRRHGRPH
jgi:SecD/SecF fusion protein